MQERRFTWSNEQASPMIEQIDRAFGNPAWDHLFSDYLLHPLSSLITDHRPLMLSTEERGKPPRRFRFQNFWPFLYSYKDVVIEAWSQQVAIVDSVKILLCKMQNMARALTAWSSSNIGNTKLHMRLAHEILFQLDHAKEFKQLSLLEKELRSSLKTRILGLAAIQRIA